MNATTTSRTPAFTGTGIFEKRSMIWARPVPALRSARARSSGPPIGLRNTILPSIMMTSVLCVLEGIAVRAHCKVIDGDAILAVGREVVFEPDAAARAERQRIVRILVGRDGVLHTRNARVGIADREPRDLPRRGNVLIEERRRHAQGGRDIVEALHLDVLRQNFLRIHVHAHQRFHGRGVLGAVQALDRDIARPLGPLA